MKRFDKRDFYWKVRNLYGNKEYYVIKLWDWISKYAVWLLAIFLIVGLLTQSGWAGVLALVVIVLKVWNILWYAS